MSEKRYWRNIDESRPDSAHYSIMTLDQMSGMESLRGMFPDGKADDLNFVLFSTSGAHGTYATIEDVESSIGTDEEMDLTFLVVHPRLVALRYGVCEPKTAEDFAYLKLLRASSMEVVGHIGMPAKAKP